MTRNWMRLNILLLSPAILLAGCASNSQIKTDIEKLSIPQQWQYNQATASANDQWLQELLSPAVKSAIKKAIENNHQLKQRQLALKAAEQNLTVSNAEFWPSLDLGLAARRSKSQTTELITNSNELSVDLRYELDIWGKLNDSDRQVNLQYQSQQLELADFQSQLVKNVISGWFNIIEARQQLKLNELRLENSLQNLAIIESGYESGLNSALDVYLTRNEVANERSRLANQKNVLLQDIRSLELLLGEYPAAALEIENSEIPVFEQPFSVGLPSDLIASKPALKASWLTVLAKDAEVAYRHKQRFPSLTLSGSVGSSSDELSELLSSDFSWSLLGNLTAPIFNAGRLSAIEKRTQFELQQAEQSYLEALFNAFAAVENSLSTEFSLLSSFRANIEAAKNATQAESLSFEQYQKGLVSYTTVLDAQTRAYSAQSAVIQNTFQLLDNRLALHFALAGDFRQFYTQEQN